MVMANGDRRIFLRRLLRQAMQVGRGRFSMVVGPRQTSVWHGAAAISAEAIASRAGRDRAMTMDCKERCFGPRHDVVRAILALVPTPARDGQVFNIGSDQPVSITGARRASRGEIVNPGARHRFPKLCGRRVFGSTSNTVGRRTPDVSKLRRPIDYRLEYDLVGSLRRVDHPSWIPASGGNVRSPLAQKPHCRLKFGLQLG